MLADGVDCSVELLPDRVLVRKSGKIVADIPIHDIDETRFRPASAFNEGHLQIRARKTVVDGMNGTAFFKARSLEAFTAVKDAINSQIVPHEEEMQQPVPPRKPPEWMRVMLSSGSWLQIDQVKLYSKAKVDEISSLRADAARVLGPSGTAIGVFGAPSWTLAAEAAAIGIVSSLIASANQRQAVASLRKAMLLHHDLLLQGGQYFDVKDVAKIMIPSPSAWSAVGEAKDIFLHNGDDFIGVVTPQGPFKLKWQEVSITAFSDVEEA